MAVINYAKKEISAKIVYYGPSVCGKTTNIQSIYASITPDQKGKLVSLATEADRTLFFDFLPIEIADIRGFKTRLHFYTVPGQVYYNSTRRAVLTGVDGLVFVADSQRDKMEENIESLQNLEENLNYYGKSVNTLPLVLQYNKRDLPAAMPIEEMQQLLNPDGRYPTFEATATTGEGVLPTLTRITKMVLSHIESGTSGKPQRPAEPAMPTHEPIAEPTPAPMPEPTPEPIPEPEPLIELEPAGDINLAETASFDELEDHRALDIGPTSQNTPVEPPQPATPGFRGGRIQVVGTGNAEIISVNAVNLPLKLKIEGDERTYNMDLAIKLDSLIPEE